MRLQAILLGISIFIYFITGLTGRFSLRKRLIFATVAYAVAYAVVLGIILFGKGPA